MPPSGIDAILAAFAISFALKAYFTKPKLLQGVQLPPGPAPLPLLGNILGVDMNAPWVTYTGWGGQYGDMVYIQLFGQDSIIINSEQIARDLLEHRSQNYSDCDRPEMGPHEIYGSDYVTVFIRYNTRWRLHRKVLQQSFRQNVIPDFRPMQEAKAHELLLNLLEDPIKYPNHLETHSGSVILSAVYSYEVAPRDDHMVEVVKMSIDTVKELKPLPVAIFNLFPFLFRLPSWLPGMGTKRIAESSQKLAAALLNTPFSHTEHGLAAGSISSCLVADHLLELDEKDSHSVLQRKVIKESAATACVAGTETLPDVQEKAQSFIDQVVGAKRLPTFEDRPSLPYIDAVLRECLRWHPVTPLGIMHAAVESDVYKGYFIPKGSIVSANIWAMCRNEHKYPNADTFNPDRFLTSDGTLTDDTMNIVWGFGRRVCPGRHLAEASLWSAMACLLATFKFSKAKDETGKDIEIEPQWKGGFTVCVVPFPCSITPRNAGMNVTVLQDLIRAV